jgi:hypothetical protein
MRDGLSTERPPYLVFDSTHLDRWVGHTLVLLEDPAAETQLRRVEHDMDSTFARAGAALHLDLAAVLFRRGAAEEGRDELSQAESVAGRVGSRRQLERAKRLRAAS